MIVLIMRWNYWPLFSLKEFLKHSVALVKAFMEWTFSYRDRKISEFLVREPWQRGYVSVLPGASTNMTTPCVWHSIRHSTRNCWRVEVNLLFTTLKTTPALLWKVPFLSENFDTKMSIGIIILKLWIQTPKFSVLKEQLWTLSTCFEFTLHVLQLDMFQLLEQDMLAYLLLPTHP